MESQLSFDLSVEHQHTTSAPLPITQSSSDNATSHGDQYTDLGQNFWASLLIIVPIFTIFGNLLVILAVLKKANLQSAINYLILGLAVADISVAVVVMPFAVYVKVNRGVWSLSQLICDMYCAADVACSTASILLLSVISFDRYRAVTRPISYSQSAHNIGRVGTIMLCVWLISLATASPMVLGINQPPLDNQAKRRCRFHNPDFSIFSSIISFGIPLVLVLFVYARIVFALRKRVKAAKQRRATRRMKMTRSRNHQTSADQQQTSTLSAINDIAAVGAGVDVEEEPDSVCSSVVGCPEIEMLSMQPNGRATSASPEVHQKITHSTSPKVNQNITHSASAVDNTATTRFNPSSWLSNVKRKCARQNGTQPARSQTHTSSLDAATVHDDDDHPEFEGAFVSRALLSLPGRFGMVKSPTRLTTALQKERERKKAQVRRERKATKTLGIVVAVFLICWVPFFWLNVQNAVCYKLDVQWCQVNYIWFTVTTWLGYLNSGVNPIIYTVFNIEFRRAFREILRCS